MNNDDIPQSQSQWVINTNEKELEELRYFKQRYFDFWEWYENNYPHTEKEISVSTFFSKYTK